MREHVCSRQVTLTWWLEYDDDDDPCMLYCDVCQTVTDDDLMCLENACFVDLSCFGCMHVHGHMIYDVESTLVCCLCDDSPFLILCIHVVFPKCMHLTALLLVLRNHIDLLVIVRVFMEPCQLCRVTTTCTCTLWGYSYAFYKWVYM